MRGHGCSYIWGQSPAKFPPAPLTAEVTPAPPRPAPPHLFSLAAPPSPLFARPPQRAAGDVVGRVMGVQGVSVNVSVWS